MKYADMNVTKVKQRQRFYMVKNLSRNFANYFKLEMVVWSQSPEQGCVKRVPQRQGGEILNVGLNR